MSILKFLVETTSSSFLVFAVTSLGGGTAKESKPSFYR